MELRDRVVYGWAVAILLSLLLAVSIIGADARQARREVEIMLDEHRLTRVYVNDLWRRTVEAECVDAPPPPWTAEKE